MHWELEHAGLFPPLFDKGVGEGQKGLGALILFRQLQKSLKLLKIRMVFKALRLFWSKEDRKGFRRETIREIHLLKTINVPFQFYVSFFLFKIHNTAIHEYNKEIIFSSCILSPDSSQYMVPDILFQSLCTEVTEI